MFFKGDGKELCYSDLLSGDFDCGTAISGTDSHSIAICLPPEDREDSQAGNA